jgi:glycosyltransferase involved in cell wall biosynthesis
MAPGADDPRPLISLVIPTMNSAALLADALQSLERQTFRDFEVIVSDGASSDASVSVAQRFVAGVPGLRIESRPDTGVYDAINRGVRLARGDWFLVLGSDDCLHAPDTLAAVAPHLHAAGDAQLVYGDVRMMAPNQCGVAPGGRFAGPMSLKRWCESNVCQQSIFYRRALFDTLGGFDLRYRLYADWAFNLRAACLAPTQWIDLVIADYAATGMSASTVDAVFMQELPALIRSELLRHPQRRALWPLQRRVLRDADRLRRRGQWGAAFACVGTYLRLLLRRLPLLLRRA